MGNGLINCCDAPQTTKLNEFTLSSPKNGLTPTHDLSRCEFLPPSINSLDYYSSNTEQRIRALSALESSNYLELKVINSGSIPKGTKLTITPRGLEGSFRLSSDGYSFFGSKKKVQGVIVNDFVIPIKDTETELHRGRHFLIFFHLEKHSYWIRDLAKGYGVFVRLDYALLLKENMLVNIGESFIVVNIVEGVLPKLVLKIFSSTVSGEIEEEIYSSFAVDKYENTYISIGRNNVCTVKVEDPLLSKIEASVFYNKSEGWMLVDGDLMGEKPSTNGTWLYLNEDFEIYTGMIFKAHQTLFQVKNI